jgi:hypothetical protein
MCVLQVVQAVIQKTNGIKRKCSNFLRNGSAKSMPLFDLLSELASMVASAMTNQFPLWGTGLSWVILRSMQQNLVDVHAPTISTIPANKNYDNTSGGTTAVSLATSSQLLLPHSFLTYHPFSSLLGQPTSLGADWAASS